MNKPTTDPRSASRVVPHVPAKPKGMAILGGLSVMAGLLASGDLSAHGYVKSPEARGYLCKLGQNGACGAIQWEPQSLEAPSGFPGAGPQDGQIASAGHTQFGALDEQTSTRWTKRDIQAGANDFTWQFTANHVTRQWRYYLTKQNWNPNQKLSRAAFESTPFCTVDGGMKQPPMTTTHRCAVPSRTGYQVILAVWEIGDTANSFYNAIDVMFKGGGGNPPPVAWTGKGTIFPTVDLAAGDQVKTRVFDATGERPELETQAVIANASEGAANHWPYLLASRINAEQTLLKAGQLASDGTINPVYGQNTVYARSDSGVSRVEIQVDQAPPAAADVSVSGLQASYTIQNGQVNIGFSVKVQGDMDLGFYVYDQAGIAKGYASDSLNNQTASETIALNQPTPGVYQLVVKGMVKGGGAVVQKTYGFSVKGGGYRYVFPNGLAKYTAGTLVLQPKNGRIYECRPFPYSGYCVQWSSSANQFEPGVGSNWQDAWIAR